jgi:hypothetical protein
MLFNRPILHPDRFESNHFAEDAYSSQLPIPLCQKTKPLTSTIISSTQYVPAISFSQFWPDPAHNFPLVPFPNSKHSYNMFLSFFILVLHSYHVFLSVHFLSVHSNQIFLSVLFLSPHILPYVSCFPRSSLHFYNLFVFLSSFFPDIRIMMFLPVLFLSLHS